MTRFARTSFAFIAALALFASAPAEAKKKPRRATAAGDVAAYERVFENAWPADGPGGAAIVIRRGEVLYRTARGMADIELGVALEPDMVFRLGSITKQFTSAAIMLLVEDGKIALDDPITKFLPDYPTNGHTITVEHLLTHTSGIKSYTNIPGYMFSAQIKDDLAVDELIDVFDDLPMEFAPGERWNYNNSGYVLLGAIIEKAGGMPYAEFIATRIFEPLGMQQSYYGGLQLIPRRVSGYDTGDAGVRNAPYLSMTQPYAAGSLLSTVDDLARWNRALFAGEVVNQASLDAMITPYTLKDGQSTNYGYGLAPSTLRGSRAIGHGGGIHGFRTQATYLPDEDVFVAVLNNSPAAPGPAMLATKAAAIAIGKPFREFSKIDLPAESHTPLVGVYRIDANAERTISFENGQLFSQRTGGARLPLHATAPNEFFFESSLTWVRFVRAADGAVTAMDVFQNGADDAETAAKISDDVPAAAEAVALEPAALDDYVGVYELAPGFDLTITRDGDVLHGQATGQGKIALTPRGDDVFGIPQVGAVLTFSRDANGRVDEVRLDQGGQQVTGSRKAS